MPDNQARKHVPTNFCLSLTVEWPWASTTSITTQHFGGKRRRLWIGVRKTTFIPRTLPSSVSRSLLGWLRVNQNQNKRATYAHTACIVGNSTSNFFFMYIALAGMRETHRNGVPVRFTILYAWLFMVGFGSLLFHATLKWSMQLLDEVPMIFMACQILHIL